MVGSKAEKDHSRRVGKNWVMIGLYSGKTKQTVDSQLQKQHWNKCERLHVYVSRWDSRWAWSHWTCPWCWWWCWESWGRWAGRRGRSWSSHRACTRKNPALIDFPCRMWRIGKTEATGQLHTKRKCSIEGYAVIPDNIDFLSSSLWNWILCLLHVSILLNFQHQHILMDQYWLELMWSKSFLSFNLLCSTNLSLLVLQRCSLSWQRESTMWAFGSICRWKMCEWEKITWWHLDVQNTQIC